MKEQHESAIKNIQAKHIEVTKSKMSYKQDLAFSKMTTKVTKRIQVT